ncbi:MAG: YhcN/YlaJ family sporulation lipoprotein [Dethiobacter sp.]|jgi:YhcN/YlaJ family sporulation lipoprotein|nr:YhcN/YlaJ family sporulation lipoprotein [Dethiobacter sp.]
MVNRRFVLIVCLILIFSLLLGGCTLPFRRPAPERVPERTPTPQPADPTPRTQPVPGQQRPGAIEMAEQVAEIATDVQGVDSAVAVVVSNLALVGVTLDRGEVAARDQAAIKREVSKRIEDEEPSIVNAFVSANPDIIKQLQDISRGIRRGEPISTFFDQITDILARMRAETN